MDFFSLLHLLNKGLGGASGIDEQLDSLWVGAGSGVESEKAFPDDMPGP